MKIGEWNVEIHNVPGRVGCEVFFYRQSLKGEGIEFISKLDGAMYETQTSNDGSAVPLFYLTPDLMQALAVALGKWKQPDEGFVQGKLQATEKHLEDMRTLVFKLQQPSV